MNCAAPLTQTLVDLGPMPLANSYVRLEDASRPDATYPLHARVCNRCLLVQVDQVVPADAIFSEYAYFSSYSESWLEHCRSYASMAIRRFNLNPTSKVVEIASNDGYLLQYFAKAGISCLGIEPAANVAETARSKGIPTKIAFFGLQTAKDLVAEGHAADLVVAKNVLAHVPDINDFVAGVKWLLKKGGAFTVEFPHLLNLIHETQFDTIYHEHFSYLSLLAIETIFARHGLRVFDIDCVPTHGGSLRIYACHDSDSRPRRANVEAIRRRELEAGLDRPIGYAGFGAKVQKIRDDLVGFLLQVSARGEIVAGYGAAAKGNTLLNYCKLSPDQIQLVVDRNPAKQNTLLPGSRIPVYAPDRMDALRPNYILILPWNIRDEVMTQIAHVRAWGARFVTAIPELRIIE